MQNLIIVSNRLPVTVKKTGNSLEFHLSDGGLAKGLSSYTQKKQTRWIGWPGIVSDDLNQAEQHTIGKELAKYRYFPVFFTQKEIDDFYNGFSNSILWPFFHNLPTKYEHQERYWRAYRSVNERFREAVMMHSQPGSTIWVHDYQLFLLPELLRNERPYGSVGFFSHIPFPEAAAFKKLPHAKSLLKGMLGADLVGFHTASYAENFLESCHELNAGITSLDQVILADRVVQVSDFPMGIDYAKFSRTSRSKAVDQEVAKLHVRYAGQKIILTVDRLDMTKGFIERLRAYSEFLQQNKNLHKKVVMIMLAIPSRAEIKAYQDLKRRIEKLVEEINSTFGTRTWQPIHYMFKSVPFEELSALYRVADVAFVAPLKDGMNLVAKEFIASQSNKDGILILSETAGAAQELTNAIMVNPRKRSSLVNGLSRAMIMQPKELKKRLSTMQTQLAEHTVQRWAGTFIKSLQRSNLDISGYTQSLRSGRQRQIITDYKKAKKRLLLLDYDGVLSHFMLDPKDAKPSTDVYKLLKRLKSNKANDIVIISGRGRKDIEEWFNKLPITLLAEHGALKRLPGKKWRKTISPSTGWKKILLPTLKNYADKTPGAHVEEKEGALVWHYRNASPFYAQKHIVILKHALSPFMKKYGLGLSSGKMILEIKPLGANKGAAVRKLLDAHHDFILALGDDYTDEDMFTALPSEAYTVKVGRGKTAARYRLGSVDETLQLLEKLSK